MWRRPKLWPSKALTKIPQLKSRVAPKTYLQQQEVDQLERCKELGVNVELRDIDGMTLPMMIVLGENEVFNMKDFAYCATDDLTGWYEKVDGERKHFEGFFNGFKIDRNSAELMVMTARLKAEIITQEDFDAIINPPVEEEEASEEAAPAVIKPAEPTEASVFKT